MKGGTRLRLGDLCSMRRNQQEVIHEPLPRPLKVRCLKREEKEKREMAWKKVSRRRAISVVLVLKIRNRNSDDERAFWPHVSRQHLGWEVSLWWTVA
ncbi:hypothetical protein AVEN_22395-1 [Araneus ventricosus]|uniref:Uncharacterized protein n=1 Tax=Araneus ventricosus TaxID=182803 RepID=A0A4Y2IKC5_ARAVE|nr:hypothetical protein AVEN_22395-1 [Araneus ventricosus]